MQMKLVQLMSEFERSARIFKARLYAFRECGPIKTLVKALWQASLPPGKRDV